jgi:hypothetical protein
VDTEVWNSVIERGTSGILAALMHSPTPGFDISKGFVVAVEGFNKNPVSLKISRSQEDFFSSYFLFSTIKQNNKL